ncbi:DUF839 domain-containing protein [Arthrospira platensis FACHB-439]|uniref:PhoX family protein n=1 Tax=Limnospira platensis TaxID=118562 RepID=UPI001689B03A|nr:DUF839 domain-containing protein [Arthrospira platensis FACHB-439]
MASYKRRDFLLFISAGMGAVALKGCQPSEPGNVLSSSTTEISSFSPSFKPVKGPMPLPTYETITVADHQAISGKYSQYEIIDDLVLPEGFTYDVIATWGEAVGDSRCGYNNDYLSFIQTGKNQGFLTVNFEYVSAKPWLETYEEVIGRSLPMAVVKQAFEAAQSQSIDAFSLPAQDPLRQAILEISKEGLIDMGMGVISLGRDSEGKWVRTYSSVDRRITGISGWTDGRYLKATGPAVGVFRQGGRGYNDRLGDKIIGTFANCAGGTTPWGTVLSAEENFQSYVTESVHPDGTSFSPSDTPFSTTRGLGNVLGLAGNKYGWIVEVNPADPEDYGTKHTWLGRYRHEAVGVRVTAGKPLAFYSGCDRRSGHLYKFVSSDRVIDPSDRQNSRLLTSGMLYAAKLYPDGTGKWIPMAAKTAVNPDPASVHIGGAIALPLRPEGGSFVATTDEEVEAFKKQYKTLGDLYLGDSQTQQGAILVDAHLAASAAGATCCARPEDTMIAGDGSLYIAFTSGGGDRNGEGPDGRIFQGPGGIIPHDPGWIVRLIEDNGDPDALRFRWEMWAAGGEIFQGGLGFCNPDNLEFDSQGNLWMVTDISTGSQNKSVPPGRVNQAGEPLASRDLMGIYGNNSLWCLPTTPPDAGQAYLFAIGPMECELCGPFFSPDQQTLFVAVQHPGEYNGKRRNMASQFREFAMTGLDGQEFMQTREVPIGSNWPGKNPTDPPKPSIVAIRRQNLGAIV